MNFKTLITTYKSNLFGTCLFMCLLFFVNSFAQAQNYIHYTVDNGLPSDELYCALQDDKGYILINSIDGLIRFDGTNFKLFDVSDGLTDNDLIGSRIDQEGRVWLTLFNGTLCIYKDGKIQNAETNPLLKRISSHFDKRDFLTYGISESGYHIFYQSRIGKFIVVDKDSIREYKLDADGINSISEVGGNFILSVGNNELSIKTNGEIKGRLLYLNSMGKVISQKDIKNGTALFYRYRNFHYSLDLYGQSLNKFEVRFNSVAPIASLKLRNTERFLLCHYQSFRMDRIFFAIDNAIYTSDTNLQGSKLFYEFEKGVEIRGHFVDRQDNLWVITWKDGIYVFPQNGSEFPEGKLIGKGQNFDVYDNTNLAVLNKKSISWLDKNNKIRTVKLPSRSSFNRIKTNENYIYLLNKLSDLVRIDKRTLQLISDPQKDTIGTSKDFDCKGNFIAIAGRFGIRLGNLGESKALLIGRTTAVRISPSLNLVYYGTLEGVRTLGLDDNNKWVQNKLHDSLNRHVISLELDEHGVLWVHEQNRIKAFYKGRIVADITKASGIVSKTINGIRVSKNRIVVSTNSGVSILSYVFKNDSITIKAIHNYNKENGLYAEYNSDAAIYKNELIVQTKKGIKTFSLSMKESTSKYKPEILEFRANNKKVHLDSLKLNYKQNYISIDFASLVYGSQPNAYFYRLKEQGDQWQATTGRSCDFLSLPPGEYTFQIKASYNLGEKFGAINELKFCIEPAFWQTWWFKILVCLILLLLFLYPLYVYFTKRKKTLESDKKLAQLRMQAVKAQMNPHFIFNSLNSIQSIVNGGDVELANQYIVKFALLIRQTLNYSSLDYISLKEELDFLHNYIKLEQYRFEHIFDYAINVDDSLVTTEILLPPMMLQIYVENAIRHGIVPLKSGGLVTISFETTDAYLCCTIDDNGVGRDLKKESKNKVFTSRGTKLNTERAEIYRTIHDREILINWIDKVDAQNKNNGTTVEVKIPLI